MCSLRHESDRQLAGCPTSGVAETTVEPIKHPSIGSWKGGRRRLGVEPWSQESSFSSPTPFQDLPQYRKDGMR